MGALGRHRKLTAAERARRSRSIRVLAGIEGIATAPALAWRTGGSPAVPERSARERQSAAHSPAGLAAAGSGGFGCIGGSCGDVRLGDGRLTAGRALCAALKQPQAIFELPVAILQFLILAGELPQLVLKLLNPHFRVDIIGLREAPCDRSASIAAMAAARVILEIWMTFWPDDEIGVTSKAEHIERAEYAKNVTEPNSARSGPAAKTKPAPEGAGEKILRKSEGSGAGVQHRDGAAVLRPARDVITHRDRTFLAIGDRPHPARDRCRATPGRCEPTGHGGRRAQCCIRGCRARPHGLQW